MCLKIDQAGKVCGQIRKTHASMLGHFIIDHGQAAEVTTDRVTKKKEYTFRPCKEDEIPLAWCRNRDVGMGEWHKRWDAKTVDRFGKSTVKRGRQPKIPVPEPSVVRLETEESSGSTIDASESNSVPLIVDLAVASTSREQDSNPVVADVQARITKTIVEDVEVTSQGSATIGQGSIHESGSEIEVAGDVRADGLDVRPTSGSVEPLTAHDDEGLEYEDQPGNECHEDRHRYHLTSKGLVKEPQEVWEKRQNQVMERDLRKFQLQVSEGKKKGRLEKEIDKLRRKREERVGTDLPRPEAWMSMKVLSLDDYRAKRAKMRQEEQQAEK